MGGEIGKYVHKGLKECHQRLQDRNLRDILEELKETFHSNFLISDSTCIKLNKKVLTVFLRGEGGAIF